MKIRLSILALSFCAITTFSAEKNSTTSTTLVASGKAQCAILIPKDDPLTKRTAEKLANYFGEQTGAKPEIVIEEKGDSSPTVIVLDGTPDHHLLAKLGIKLDVPADRDDAYHIRVIPQEKRTVIAIAGHTSSGAKFGAYRLMEEMEIANGKASVAQLDITASPFFKTRSVSLFNIWRVPVEIVRQCNLESWPKEKIQANVEMYDALGFNALETHDRFHEDFLKAVYGITRKEWRNKVYVMCDRAHEDGMTVFLRQWGNSVALPVKELKNGYTPFGYVNLVPDIPEEKARWNAEIRDYCATNYASHIDQLIGHWADASGIHEGSHATIKDAMLLHNELAAAFKAINPKIETSFNLWNMANPRGHRSWPGYVDQRTITTAGILPKDVIIAQATRANSHRYSQKVTDEIVADGYRAAVWTWRRGDTEVRLNDPGLRIRIHGVMGDYFHDLPDAARELDWHNIERNHHGLANDVNYFVASKLMWDPKADVDAALDKYCALVFGKENAQALAEAFLTIEACHDVENQVSKYVLQQPVVAAKRARSALAGLEKVKLAEGHHSRLPSVTSPEEMLKELRGTLDVIAQNADICAKELPAIDALIQVKKMDAAKAQADRVLKKTASWSGTIAGGMEGMWLKETLDEKFDSNAENKTKSWFGFRTRGLTAFEEMGAQYAVVGQGKAQATALLSLDPPAQHKVEFQFQFTAVGSQSSPKGKKKFSGDYTGEFSDKSKSHNGGLAFGAGLQPDDLIRCQAYLGGSELRVRGANLVKPVIVKADFASGKTFDCAVSVDLDQHKVTFKVGENSATADLKKSFNEIRWYGYVVENTKTKFSKIEVK